MHSLAIVGVRVLPGQNSNIQWKETKKSSITSEWLLNVFHMQSGSNENKYHAKLQKGL